MLAWLAPFVLWLLGFAILLGVLGSLKETLRNAEDLSCRLSACEGQLVGVVQEWTDVLDKLLAREERERKRNAKALKGSLVADPVGDLNNGVTPSKADLLALARKRRVGS